MTLESPGSRFYLGIDVGQARDYSALAVVERRVTLTGVRDPITFLDHTAARIIVSHLERIPLHTSYADVVECVRAHTQRFQGRKLEIIMDATGVGNAFRDMLVQARLGFNVFGVTLTGGERVAVIPGGYHVPRHDLLANLRILLEKHMLEICLPPRMADLLRTEFLRWGQRSAHDDLIFAVALGCWKAGGQSIPLYGSGPMPFVYPKIRK